MKDIVAKAEEYKRTVAVISRAHYIAWERATNRQRWLGVPVVMITAAVGSSIFATINNSPSLKWKIIAGIISLVASVLAALQTSFKYSEIADSHKSAGGSYASMRRRLDLFFLKFPPESTDRAAAVDEINEVIKDLNDLAKRTPSIPDNLYYAAVNQLHAEQEKTLQTFNAYPGEPGP